MKDKKIYAFDFFDTIVHRDCNSEVVLYEWSRNCARYVKFKYTTGHIYAVRKNAEKELKQQPGIQEPSYHSLIKRISEELNISCFDDFYEKAELWDTEIECKHLYLDIDCVKVINTLVNSGHKVIIISDFYSSKKILTSILKKFEIEHLFEEIYVSSEINYRKSTGDLYKYVVENLGVSFKDIEMSGDNLQSDVEIPKKLGMEAIHRKWKHQIKLDTARDFKKKYKKIVFSEAGELNGYAGEIALYIDKLYKQLVRDGFTKVLFCSREGQLIKKLFDQYQEIYYGNDLIETVYFYISRKAVLAPSLKEISEETFDSIFRQYKEISVRDFISSIGLKDCNNILINAGISMDDIITSNKKDPVLEKLRVCTEFVEMYDKWRISQRSLFVAYVNKIFTPNKKNEVAIVDIGWKGTIQDCIQRIVGNTITIRGYYLGLLSKKFESINLSNKYGVLFSDTPIKSNGFDILSAHCMYYERIFVANHGPVMGYCANKDTGIAPLINNDPRELELFDFLQRDQSALIDTFYNVIQLYNRSKREISKDESLIIKGSLWRQCVYSSKHWRPLIESRSKAHENFGNISTNGKDIKANDHKHMSEVLYADYSFRLLYKLHLNFMKPLAELYGRLAYYILILKMKNDRR